MQRDSDGDRRSHVRTSLVATAVLFREEVAVGRYLAVNLSARGALLRGGADQPRGPIRVALLLPDGELMSLPGKVVRRIRSYRGQPALAVCFEHESPYSEDRLQELVAAALTRGERVIDVSGPLELLPA